MISGICTTGQSGWQGQDPGEEFTVPQGQPGARAATVRVRILPVLIRELLCPFHLLHRLTFPHNLAPSHPLTVVSLPYLFLEALLFPYLSLSP